MSLRRLYDGSIQQLVRWAILALLFPLIGLNAWLVFRVFHSLQPLLTVCITAALLALILNYPVQFLHQRHLPRPQAVTLVLTLALLGAIALGVILLPILAEDVNEITQLLPQWIESGTAQLNTLQQWLDRSGLPVSLGRLVNQLAIALPNRLQAIADQAVTLVLDTIGGLSEGLLVTVLTVYFLADGERLVHDVFDWLPSPWDRKIRRSLQENFQNYFRGQAVLAFLVGLSITVIFTLLQIPYSLLIGLGIGAMTLIPFGDLVTCIVVSGLLGFQDIWLGARVLIIFLITDQLIDQIVAPRLLGKFTGLRPVWVLLSLLVGAKLGGVLGLVIAVPVASIIRSAFHGFESIDSSTSPTPISPPNGSAEAIIPAQQ